MPGRPDNPGWQNGGDEIFVKEAHLVRAVGAVVLLGVFAALVASASGSPQRVEYRFRQVASGFDQPVYLAQPKSEPGRLYVVERPGRIISLTYRKRQPSPIILLEGTVPGQSVLSGTVKKGKKGDGVFSIDQISGTSTAQVTFLSDPAFHIDVTNP